MKYVWLFSLLSCSLLAIPGDCEEGQPFLPFYPYIPHNQDDFKVLFDEWMLEYDRTYDSDVEYEKRLKIFMDNALYIDWINNQQNSYELEANQFADMTFDEFKSIYLMDPQHCSATKVGSHQITGQPVPEAVDWREKGVVTPVKNQGQCGSCWTFSTTGSVESHHAIKTSNLISLSEQQLIDCAGAFNNHGCRGGLPSQAFEYIHYNGGLESEKDYPYRAHDETCSFKTDKVAATVSSQVNITEKDEDMILDAVANVGPVSICYDVSSDFRFYKKGVYSSKRCKDGSQNVNHAALVEKSSVGTILPYERDSTHSNTGGVLAALAV
ncbi:pro-cathepsin H-like isoform X2 [Dysidea avara]|uniref:pro-cathepsin H-like isoform X2 n=1 Tax=Dysidea avara TaxID=196820 RepID=UPI00332684C1